MSFVELGPSVVRVSFVVVTSSVVDVFSVDVESMVFVSFVVVVTSVIVVVSSVDVVPVDVVSSVEFVLVVAVSSVVVVVSSVEFDPGVVVSSMAVVVSSVAVVPEILLKVALNTINQPSNLFIYNYIPVHVFNLIK